MAKLVSQTYAEALFSLGLENGCLDELEEQFTHVCSILKEYPDYVSILTHPQLETSEKEKLFDKAFGENIREELTGLFHIMLEKGRFKELEGVYACFSEKWKAYRKIGVAYVTSAVELDDSQKQKVTDRLLATTDFVSMEMHFDTDASLIGGMKIRIGDRVVDSSIQTKLEEMKKMLMKVQLSSAER